MYGGNQLIVPGFNNKPAFEYKKTDVKVIFTNNGMVVFNAVGDNLAIRFSPITEGYMPGNGVKKYNTQQNVSIMFKIDSLGGFTDILEKEFIPVILEVNNGGKLKKPLKLVIANTSNNALKFEYKASDEGVPTGYLSIMRMINPDTFELGDGGTEYTIPFDKQKLKIGDDILMVDTQMLSTIHRLMSLSSSFGSVGHTVTYAQARDEHFKSNSGYNNYSGGGGYNNYNNGGGFNNFSQPSNYGGSFSYPNSNNSNQTFGSTSLSPSIGGEDDLPF